MLCRFVAIAGMIAVSACGAGPMVAVEDRQAIVDVELPEVADPGSSDDDTSGVAPPDDPPPPTEIASRESAETCRIGSRTLDTAIEAHFAQYGEDISSADELVETGLLIEIPVGFVVDVSGETPSAAAFPGGPCDFDFESATASQSVDDPIDDDLRLCWASQISLGIAVNAYQAQFGRAPASLDDLVALDADFVADRSTVDLDPDGRIIDLVPGGCDIADHLEVIGPDWIGASPQCAVDGVTLAFALEFVDRFGDPTVSIDLLIDDGLIDDRTYLYAIVAGEVADVEASGCPSVDVDDVEEQETARFERACLVEQRTIATAVESLVAQQSRAPESLTELVDAGLLSDVPDRFVLNPTDRTGDPIPGGECDLPALQPDTSAEPVASAEPVDPTQPVDADEPVVVSSTVPATVPATDSVAGLEYTLEVHTDGCGVFRSGEIGDDLTWVVTDDAGFQVLGRNAAGETQYRYYRAGTYTVVLESWGGSYYVPVSNEVTIVC